MAVYSNKTNVNLLTALLVAHGVRYAVVCPGSRNAPLVHDLSACGSIRCFPVTDERSAGFQALGLCQATGGPVVVCVTSGTALLNLAPAVAEAFYQHLPLVVVSADRPPQWIGQLDGQTMPQPDALGRFVRKAVSLPEPCDEEQHWYCNRLVNEALIAARRDGGGPVHINVPITPPLYDFTEEDLPHERKIEFWSCTSHACGAAGIPFAHALLEGLRRAERPLIVLGQMKPKEVAEEVVEALEAKDYVVLREPLAGPVVAGGLDAMLQKVSLSADMLPDFILYAGGTLVSRRLKAYLRHCHHAACWRVDARGEVADTFLNLTGVVQALPQDVLAAIAGPGNVRWADYWRALGDEAWEHCRRYQPDYSGMLAVKLFEERLQRDDCWAVTHYANSMAVRLGCVYAPHHIFCNRGVNGIEGSLSTAAGFSLVAGSNVYCVVGDLSFFYDRNALWNRNLRGNLRVLLLNNGGGGIFEKFSGHLGEAFDRRNVMAQHHTTARGMCEDNGVAYRRAGDAASLDEGLRWLTSPQTERPMLLEVVTDAGTDWATYQRYFESM